MITPEQERKRQEAAGIDYSQRGTVWQTLAPIADGWTGVVKERHRCGHVVSTDRAFYSVDQLKAVYP